MSCRSIVTSYVLCFAMQLLFAVVVVADISPRVPLDFSGFVGQPILIRDIGAKFVHDGHEVLAVPGKNYLVERTEGSKIWVRGQAGHIDANSVLVAKEAAVFFTNQLHEAPTSENYLSRGQAWSAQKKFDRALVDYEAALRLNPNLSIAENGRGNCLQRQGDYDGAIKAYTRAIESKSDYAAAYNNRANAWRTMGEFEKALIDYEATLQLKPDAVGVIYSRGVCYSALGRLDEAIAAYDAAVQLVPTHADALNQRGLAWQRKGDALRAIASYTAATNADPHHFEAYNNLAWVLANCQQKELRSPKRAVEMATKACKITNYQNWYCVGTLAASYARSGKFKEAAAIQKKAIDVMPRGTSEADRGDYEKRLKLYRMGAKRAA